MLPRVDWMATADPLIVLFLTEHRWRIAANPATIALNCGLSQSHTNKRIGMLTDAGLLELADDRGYYRATDLGQRFILGDVSAEELEDRDPR